MNKFVKHFSWKENVNSNGEESTLPKINWIGLVRIQIPNINLPYSGNIPKPDSVIKWKRWSCFRTVLYEKVSSIWTANRKPDVSVAIWKSAPWNPDTFAIQIPDSSGIQIVVTVIIFFAQIFHFFAQIWHFCSNLTFFCSNLSFFAQLWLNLRLWTWPL